MKSLITNDMLRASKEKLPVKNIGSVIEADQWYFIWINSVFAHFSCKTMERGVKAL